MRTKVWNEHVKLAATLFNAVSIGVLGVAVIGPLAQPENPFYGWDLLADEDKMNSLVGATEKLTVPSPLAVIEWKAIGIALLIHALAHVILRAQVDEQP